MNESTVRLPLVSPEPRITLRNPPKAPRRLRVVDPKGKSLATIEPGDSADFEATPERRKGEVLRSADGAPIVKWTKRSL